MSAFPIQPLEKWASVSLTPQFSLQVETSLKEYNVGLAAMPIYLRRCRVKFIW